MMNKKKKAPARAKAYESYILSTKLFCGYCGAPITGISATSHTGKKYHYYQCSVNRRDRSCKKKSVGKSIIEDIVVNNTRALLTKSNIDLIAQEVVRLCEQESSTDNLKLLKKQLKENEKATDNLLKVLERGQITDIIMERISQKKKEHEEIEHLIRLEKASHPMPTLQEIRFFLNQFKNGNVNDEKYRQALVDTFVNKIYLYDEEMTILYNTQDGHTHIALDELGSSKGVLAKVVNFDTIFTPPLVKGVKLLKGGELAKTHHLGQIAEALVILLL